MTPSNPNESAPAASIQPLGIKVTPVTPQIASELQLPSSVRGLVVQEVDREKGAVPHLLPGANPFTTEFATRYGIPLEATRGGAATMYPDFRLKLKNMPPPPPAQPQREQGR